MKLWLGRPKKSSMVGWMDGWMDGVVLIRCIDRWMVSFCTLPVPARWFPPLFFRAFFWYPLEHSFSHFWLPPGPPADPKMRSKTPKVGLRRHFFPNIRFHHEIWCFYNDFWWFFTISKAFPYRQGRWNMHFCKNQLFHFRGSFRSHFWPHFGGSGHPKSV